MGESCGNSSTDRDVITLQSRMGLMKRVRWVYTQAPPGVDD